MTPSRTQEREIALKILYMYEITGNQPGSEGIDKHAIPETEIPAFAHELVGGVFSNLGVIDEKISHASQNWKLYRMSIIDRNILRIACYEILYRPEIPGNVTINEAVNLAKKFGGENSGAFINGVLDHIAHEAGKLIEKEKDENQFLTDTTRKI